jgi:hypothetical protein
LDRRTGQCPFLQSCTNLSSEVHDIPTCILAVVEMATTAIILTSSHFIISDILEVSVGVAQIIFPDESDHGLTCGVSQCNRNIEIRCKKCVQVIHSAQTTMLRGFGDVKVDLLLSPSIGWQKLIMWRQWTRKNNGEGLCRMSVKVTLDFFVL